MHREVDLGHPSGPDLVDHPVVADKLVCHGSNIESKALACNNFRKFF